MTLQEKSSSIYNGPSIRALPGRLSQAVSDSVDFVKRVGHLTLEVRPLDSWPEGCEEHSVVYRYSTDQDVESNIVYIQLLRDGDTAVSITCKGALSPYSNRELFEFLGIEIDAEETEKFEALGHPIASERALQGIGDTGYYTIYNSHE